MNLEQVFASLGLGNLVAQTFYVTQAGMVALGGILFVASLALCIMAARSASAARQARNDVRGAAASMQDMAIEMRQLTAQVERANYAQNRVEPEGDANNGGEARDEASLDASEEEIDPQTEGKRIRPSALLRGFLSRR